MKPYPRYKPTGLAWLPSVPEHWDVRKAKFLIRVGNGSDPKTDGDIPVYGSGAASFKTCGEYKEGPCVLVGRKGATLHIPHYVEGKYWNVDTSFDVKTTSGDYSLRYYYYCATRFDYQYYIAQTTLPGMAKSDYLNMPLPVPPPSEQDRIVRYLDEKTAAIDELVRAKERQIELLRERKQALVSAAVTGGLDPATERKDSGVPWIGKIPKGWNVAKTGHLFHMVLGKMLANAPSSPTDTFERYACAKDVHFSGVDTSDLKEMWFSPEEKRLYQTRHGDLLIVEGGAGAGGAAIVEDDGGYCIQNSIHLLRSKHDLGWTPFLKYWIYSLVSRGYIEHACNKATIPHFTKDKVFNMPIPVPPLPEQQRIVAHLDSVCSELDAAEAAIRKQIALLQELRTRLVSDAVTGAVEV